MAAGDVGPSERDIRIYVAHKIEGIPSRRCGKKFGLDHSTILRICQAVRPWVVRQLVADHPDRLTLKLETHARYERIWQEANRGWQRSLKNAETLKLKGVATSEGEGVVTDTEKTSKGQSGDPAFLAQMAGVEKAIRELWGLDEEPAGSSKAPGVQVNMNGGECKIVVVEDENWYGNRAHDKARIAESPAPPIAGPDLSGPLQGGSVRAAVGQNGSGVNGSH